MKRTLRLLTFVLLVAVMASAKDRQYETGTVERVTGKAGWTDTTSCVELAGDVHCAGGIHDDYVTVYVLTCADGTRRHIEHVPFTRDTVKHLDYDKGAVTVQYRIERRMGADSAAIVDPSNPKKEGWYGFDALKVRK